MLLVALFCIGIGYYAWQQQKTALNGLQQARKQGAKIDFFLYSRPLFAVDSTHKVILLIDSTRTVSLKFSEINTVRFTEAPYTSQYNAETKKPDTITINLTDGQHYRVGDLKTTAREAATQFRAFAPEVESIIKYR